MVKSTLIAEGLTSKIILKKFGIKVVKMNKE